MKVVKLTENDLTRIVKRVLVEQFQAPEGLTPVSQSKQTGNEKLIDSLFKQRGATKNAQGKWVFPCLKKLESMKVPGSTAKFDVAGTIYTFFSNGTYSRVSKTDKSQGTWKCDTQGFVELDGKQKLGKSFQWKTAPTEEEVKNGVKVLKYGMQGEFVGKVQKALNQAGITPGPIDNKFGGKTLQAVKDFQKKSGLNVDGLFGKNTYSVLFKTEQKTPEQKTPEQSQVEKTNVAALQQQKLATQPQSGQVQRQSQIPAMSADQDKRAARRANRTQNQPTQASTSQVPTDNF